MVAWVCGAVGLTLAWVAAAGYIGPARDALRSGRAARRTATVTAEGAAEKSPA